ncbi:DNA/RNA helicase domain-containing protein [Sphingobacterium haloxyli]|uniref:Schlafen group 3-like DNA/RNA helicase domain-containing protein n=1 Tax=Sphingobacterium haloxyli TaxID=2100533 RepID=A0A2S9J013_9SPHI|nr:DNA/RNA helicase domain-containing protein [Sphingobacterium haloxyli]PRD46119.1 hypothetical protein C5745_16990 [Sphingobacterium haloxyli]
MYDTVMSLAQKAKGQDKYAIIVKGGAGTGKSVVGLQLLADLTALDVSTHYATGAMVIMKLL